MVVSNAFGITLMLMLLVSAGNDIRGSDFAKRIFYSMIWATIALCAMEMSAFLLDGRQFPGARALNWLLNSLLFAVNIVFAFQWTMYVDYKLFEDPARLRRRCRWLAIPMAAVLVLVVVNLFTPVFFTVSADNVYTRTPLILIPFGVSFFYLGYSEWLIYNNKNNVRRYLFLPSVLFLLPLVAASVLQMLFYGLSLIWAALAISLASVYINVQCQFSSVDSLSGVYSRQYLDDYLRRCDARHTYEGIMIDLDRFKQINDTLGHQSGDGAIRDFGRLLRTAADRRDVVARYGGDEFVLIRRDAQGGSLQDFAARLMRDTEAFGRGDRRPYRVAFSYGIASYDPGRQTPDVFLLEMDRAMYECKKARSSKLPDRRSAASFTR